MNYKDELNEKQYEAVTTQSQFVRIIAGAGSGKTRVLTYRIAYLISELGVAPWNILAITFTNKVANEMRTRVMNMLPNGSSHLTIKTFHSFAAYFLRYEISVLGFPSSFTILDEEDQTKIVKDIATERGYKRSDKIVGQALSYIGNMKLKEKYPDDITITKPSFENEKECLEIYSRYEEIKAKALSLDFDDLLLKTNYILNNYPDIRTRWQNKINYILIDEFQDTNDVEYKLIKSLMKPSTSLYVVGDPDQTIYTWRGANQRIILDLEKAYKQVETIILDRNYRSTQNILNSANKLISNNKMRVHKNLFTEKKGGNPVVVKNAPSSKNEADYVAREIKTLVNSGKYKFSDIAVLYRSNYITLEFETSFTAAQIPYKIYGGQKFYQRREIKDVLAYFHLVLNKNDNISFERIFNVPRRGIGESSWKLIKSESEISGKPYYEFIENIDSEDSDISSKVLGSLKRMIFNINEARANIDKNEEVFSKTLEDLINNIGYYDYLKKEDDGDERIENVKALFADIRHFLKTFPDSSFDEYLQNISLLTAQDDIIDGDYITLMTVHTSKGLEYPVVFVVRLNSGVFPNNRALLEDGFKALEEERRLAYVAMTRAKELLYLTCASDFSYVIGGALTPSQFFKESGNTVNVNTINMFQGFRPQPQAKSRKTYDFDDDLNSSFTTDEPIRQEFMNQTNGVSFWKVGDIVIHRKLGKGIVVELEGDDIIKVNFQDNGIKSILGNHPAVKKGEKDES